MKKVIFIFSILILVFTSSAETVSLEEGWNTVAFNEEFSKEDIVESTSCDILPLDSEENEKYLWTYDNGWDSVDNVDPWKAYLLSSGNDCDLEVGSISTYEQDVSLEVDQWSLIKKPESMSFESLNDKCSFLNAPDTEHKDWILKGSEWLNPTETDDLSFENRGVLVWPSSSCSYTISNQQNENEAPSEVQNAPGYPNKWTKIFNPDFCDDKETGFAQTGERWFYCVSDGADWQKDKCEESVDTDREGYCEEQVPFRLNYAGNREYEVLSNTYEVKEGSYDLNDGTVKFEGEGVSQAFELLGTDLPGKITLVSPEIDISPSERFIKKSDSVTVKFDSVNGKGTEYDDGIYYKEFKLLEGEAQKFNQKSSSDSPGREEVSVSPKTTGKFRVQGIVTDDAPGDGINSTDSTYFWSVDGLKSAYGDEPERGILYDWNAYKVFSDNSGDTESFEQIDKIDYHAGYDIIGNGDSRTPGLGIELTTNNEDIDIDKEDGEEGFNKDVILNRSLESGTKRIIFKLYDNTNQNPSYPVIKVTDSNGEQKTLCELQGDKGEEGKGQIYSIEDTGEEIKLKKAESLALTQTETICTKTISSIGGIGLRLNAQEGEMYNVGNQILLKYIYSHS